MSPASPAPAGAPKPALLDRIKMAPWLLGGGQIEAAASDGLRLSIPAKASGYADSQFDDYRAMPRSRLLWSPPLCFRVRARASHAQPKGTLGFGFWNDPFAVSVGQRGAARRLPVMPKTLWFFYGSPPNNFSFAADLPGHGWKAACIDTIPLPAGLLVPLGMAGLVVMSIPILRAPALRLGLRTVRASEALLGVALDDWHEYAIHWMSDRAIFEVDQERVLEAAAPPRGPLGFVAWIDNQFAVASPQAGLRFGVVATSARQWLELQGFSLNLGTCPHHETQPRGDVPE